MSGQGQDTPEPDIHKDLLDCAVIETRELPERLVLLRTLALPDQETRQGTYARERMNLSIGDIIELPAGSSTSPLYPHWLGTGGVLLIIDGVDKGVPMAKEGGYVDEVLITEPYTLRVTDRADAFDCRDRKGDSMRFEFAYRARVVRPNSYLKASGVV